MEYQQILYCFLGSLRVFEDMCATYRCNINDNEIGVYIRPYLEFDKWDEYRLFYVNDKLSVCSYHKFKGSEVFESDIISDKFVRFNEDKIKPYINIKDYCIDVIDYNGELLLVEINPYGLSDPILLDHSELTIKEKQITYKKVVE